MSRLAIGIISALAGACLWGFSGTCSQYLLENYDMSPVYLTLIRMLAAGAIFLVLIFIKKRDDLKKIAENKRDMLRLTAFGCAGLVACPLAYSTTIMFSNAGTATVLQCLNIVMIMLIVCVTTRRLPKILELLGLIFAFAATYLITTKGEVGALNLPLPALFWGLMTAAAAAFYTMFPRRLLMKYDSIAVTGCGMAFGALGMCVLSGAFLLIGNLLGADSEAGSLVLAQLEAPALDMKGYLAFACFVVVGTVCSYTLFLHGVSLVGSVKGSMIGAAEPVSAMVFSSLWLGTPFVWADWVGLVLMVATIALVALQPAPESAGD